MKRIKDKKYCGELQIDGTIIRFILHAPDSRCSLDEKKKKVTQALFFTKLQNTCSAQK